ncbi:unnamed protein product [Owenia fusiformis]|uniref:Uncharacterized protein n=1 Tax=Owenia fusiformis TaxID=6347 RepID=A0A8J1TBP9_OWEFU|nr:unnamed protein product [Owenia fusiformis]
MERLIVVLMICGATYSAPAPALQEQVKVDKRAMEEIVYGNHQNSERLKKSVLDTRPQEQVLEQAVQSEEDLDEPFEQAPVDPSQVDSKAKMTVSSGALDKSDQSDVIEQSNSFLDSAENEVENNDAPNEKGEQLNKEVIDLMTTQPERQETDTAESELANLEDNNEYIQTDESSARAESDYDSEEQSLARLLNDEDQLLGLSKEGESSNDDSEFAEDDEDGSGEVDSAENEADSSFEKDPDYFYNDLAYLKKLYDEFEPTQYEYPDYFYYPYKRKRRDTKSSSKRSRVKRDLFFPDEYKPIRGNHLNNGGKSVYPGWSREALEELMNSERPEAPPMFGREMEPGYMSEVEKAAEEAKDRLEVLEWLYGDGYKTNAYSPQEDSYEYEDEYTPYGNDGWIEEPVEDEMPDYENIIYNGEPGIFVPLKRSSPVFSSSIPFRKRGFYPAEEEPLARWQGLVLGPKSRRAYKSAYDRVYELAQALDRKRGLPSLESQENKK